MSVPRRVCFVVPSLGRGGAERALVEVANGLEASFDVSVITFDDAPPSFTLHPGIRVRRIGNATWKVPGRPLFNLARRLLACRRLIRAIRPDVLISFTDVASVHMLVAAPLSRTPLILSEHSNPARSKLSRVQRAIRKRAYRRASAVVVLTRETLSIFHALGVALPHIRRVIHNPLATDLVPTDDVTRLERADVVLFVGRLAPEKQVDHLLDIFHAADLKGWQLQIVGDGPERPRLEEYARRRFSDPERVVFLGARSALAPLYRRARILALTSRHEGLPTVLLEAMANGCVCVSYDCQTGPSELIQDSVDGILVPPQDRERFVEALVTLATDRERYLELQRAAAARYQSSGLDQAVAAWCELIDVVGATSRHRVAGTTGA